jgi:GNAT superfamily N-acetyltransferase
MKYLKHINILNQTFDGLYEQDIRYAEDGSVKKVKFDIESREGEEDRTTISINGIGKVDLIETFPEYEFLEDIGEDGLEELGVEEGDFIGKIEHLEIEDEYKGQGYAKSLMNKAIELAKEKGLMPLYLNASPMGSDGLDIDDLTRFYESFGFEVFLEQRNNNLMILKYKNNPDIKLAENREPMLSQFVIDNLRDLKAKLYYYNGNFAFLKSLKEQYKKKGYLTDTQWKAAYNCFYK